jgi:hypothetical protein
MLSLIVGAALGAAAMYFFDRNSGAGRREDVKDRASGTARQVRTQVDNLSSKVRKAPETGEETVQSAPPPPVESSSGSTGY